LAYFLYILKNTFKYNHKALPQLIKEKFAMSTKFEQLLDLIVNEEMDKANELFHEIVVEKSRNIYENLIAQEAEEAEEDQPAMEADDELEEADDELEEADDELEEGDVPPPPEDQESPHMAGFGEEEEFESAFGVEGDDPEASGEEETGDLGDEVSDMGPEMGMDDEAGPADVKDELADVIDQLEMLLGQMGGEEGGDGMPASDEFGDKMSGDDDTELKMGVPAMESKKRMTREYTENVGMNWEKGNTMKTQKQHVGAGSGDTEGAPNEGKSPIASGSNKPGPGGVNAKNLNQGATEGQSNTGTSPGKVSKGLAPHSGEKMAAGMHNVDRKQSGVKTLTSVKGGHGAEKKGSGPGPVGSGTGDKAGQTSTPAVKQFLKPYSK